MNAEEHRVLTAVEQATPLLAQAAERVAAVFGGGGRTVFIGSGTSGRIALQEAAELPPTFGVPRDSFVVIAAGDALMGPTAITWNEDDQQAAPARLAELGIGRRGRGVRAGRQRHHPVRPGRGGGRPPRRGRGPAGSPTIPARRCWPTGSWGSCWTPGPRC